MDRFTVVGYLPEAVGGESPSSPPLSLASRICLSIRRRKAKILTGNFLAMQTNGSKSLYRDRNSAPPPIMTAGILDRRQGEKMEIKP